MFFLLILAFAVLVGPVGYLWLKRRRRLPWLVVLVPLAGFVMAGVILFYGFLSEGFGIRGSARAFTVLDQGTHEATTVASRTLFAGLSPGALQPGPGSLIVPRNEEDDEVRGAWAVDVGDGWRHAGSALPSRTETAFATVTTGRARERLRFRRLDTGHFEVLHGPDFAPVVEEGAVLLRTEDGTWYRSDATGVLVPFRPTATLDHEAAVRRLLTRMAGLPLGAERPPQPGRYRHRYGWRSGPTIDNEGPHGFVAWFDLLGFGSGVDLLPPGAYLAETTRSPAFDTLGLDVDYEQQAWVVLGFLGPEDIVE